MIEGNHSNVVENFYERSLSENIEISYNALAIFIGMPINFWALCRYSTLWRERQANRRVILGFNLTIANILILIIYCPTQVAWLISISWPWGEVACQIRMFFSVLVYHLSSNAIVVIAIEMLRTLYKPLKSRQHGVHRNLINVLCCWLAAIACSCPQFFTWGLVDIPGVDEVQCVFVYTEDILFIIVYQLIHLLTVFYIPLLVIIFCYAALGCVVGKQLRTRRSLHEQLQETSSTSSLRSKRKKSSSSGRSYSSTRSQTSINTEVQSARIKWKLIRVSAAVILSYILCWLPYQALAVWSTSAQLKMRWFQNITEVGEDPFPRYINWLEALMISSACINPILYTYHGL